MIVKTNGSFPVNKKKVVCIYFCSFVFMLSPKSLIDGKKKKFLPAEISKDVTLKFSPSARINVMLKFKVK